MGSSVSSLEKASALEGQLSKVVEIPDEASEQMRGTTERTMVLELGQGSETTYGRSGRSSSSSCAGRPSSR